MEKKVIKCLKKNYRQFAIICDDHLVLTQRPSLAAAQSFAARKLDPTKSMIIYEVETITKII
jgi:hypothetical protein